MKQKIVILKKKRKRNQENLVEHLNPRLISQTRDLLNSRLRINHEAQPLINLMMKDEIA